MNDKEFRPIEELSYKEASIELEQIVRIMRQNIDLTEALSEVTYSPRHSAPVKSFT